MLSKRQKENGWGREKTANEKERKMPYNGLSANAKGWLLAKHHFATSSIFHQHVKGSAPASLSPTTPSFFFFLHSFNWRGLKSKNLTMRVNNRTLSGVGRLVAFVFSRVCKGFCVPTNTWTKTQKTHSHPLFSTVHCLASGQPPMIHSWPVLCAACALSQTVRFHVVNKTEFAPFTVLTLFHLQSLILQTLLYTHTAESQSNFF